MGTIVPSVNYAIITIGINDVTDQILVKKQHDDKLNAVTTNSLLNDGN